MAKPVKINSVVKNILKETEERYPDQSHKIWDIWDEAVGPDLASRCAPIALSHGKLTVAVASPLWLQQLSLLSTTLIENVNRLLGGDYVKKAVFKQADIKPPLPQSEQLPDGWDKYPLTEDEKKYISETSGVIADDELAATVRALISKALRRGRLKEPRG